MRFNHLYTHPTTTSLHNYQHLFATYQHINFIYIL